MGKVAQPRPFRRYTSTCVKVGSDRQWPVLAEQEVPLISMKTG